MHCGCFKTQYVWRGHVCGQLQQHRCRLGSPAGAPQMCCRRGVPHPVPLARCGQVGIVAGAARCLRAAHRMCCTSELTPSSSPVTLPTAAPPDLPLAMPSSSSCCRWRVASSFTSPGLEAAAQAQGQGRNLDEGRALRWRSSCCAAFHCNIRAGAKRHTVYRFADAMLRESAHQRAPPLQGTAPGFAARGSAPSTARRPGATPAHRQHLRQRGAHNRGQPLFTLPNLASEQGVRNEHNISRRPQDGMSVAARASMCPFALPLPCSPLPMRKDSPAAA